jgi:molecular chaperone DnaK
MMREAEQHADEDRQQKETIELKNQGDQAVYAAEKFLTDNSDKVPQDVRTGLDSAVATLKGALDRNDADGIKKGLTDLTQAQHKAAEAMYRAAGAGAPTGQEPGGDAGADSQGSARKDDGGVIDAEVVDEGK